MPELPEVETIARQLDRALKGQVIRTVEVRHRKSFKGSKAKVEGQKIGKIWRRAKLIIVELGSGCLLIHLKMTGQLVYQRSGSGKRRDRVVGGHPTGDWLGKLPSKYTRVIFTLDKGKLYFNDMRVFGWLKLMSKSEMEKELEKFGPDINGQELTPKYFYEVLQSSGRAVKLVIMDQAKVAGVGNIYANDGLWCAKIRPGKRARDLTRKESDMLFRCLEKVVNKGIKYGGATASDENFVNALGMGGKYQEHFLVYEQVGKRCQRKGCAGKIVKEKLGGRGTYYCDKCQK